MKTIIIFLLISFSCSLLFGQAYQVPADPTYETTIPPSPQAWQFGKYGEYPVDRSTGVPSISIPIYEVKAANLSVPISLSYHASGIKVDDKASWVGLGWSLNSGGMISRVVKGHPDEHEHGYLQSGIQSSIVPADLDGIRKLAYYNEGTRDSEPDIFYYNFNGQNGKFFFKANGEIITQPSTDLKIVYETGTGGITEISITTPAGITYEFSECQSVSYRLNPDNLYTNGLLEWQAHSAWYLTKIYSISNNNIITFNYSQSVTDFEKMPKQSETIKVLTGSSGSGYTTEGLKDEVGYPNSYSGVKFLESIEYANGKVEFVSTSDRLDSNEPRLTKIKIYGVDQTTPFKTFNFTQDYFETTGGLETKHNYRLKLISVQEEGLQGSTIPPYEITYKDLGDYKLPPRYDNSQDYWGYHNGESNTSLIPQFTYNVGGGTYYTFGSGNDRDVDTEHIKSGIIEKIKYPTGGITEFEFEANQVRDNGLNKYVGGLRIKSLKSYTEGELSSQKYFLYTDPNDSTISSGFYNSYRMPEPSHFLSSTEYRYLDGSSNENCNPVFDTYVAMYAKPNNMLGYPIGDPVTYAYVTEVFEEQQNNYGKSVFQYDTFRDYIFSSVHEFNLDKSPLRGQLRHEYHYDQNDNLVSETIIDYDTVMVDRIFGHKVGKLFELNTTYNGFGCPSCWTCASGENSFCNCDDDIMFNLYNTMYLYQKYYEDIFWKRQISVETITYSSNDFAKYTSTVKEFEYNGTGHQQVTNIKVTDSNNTLHETKIKYPTDYGAQSSTLAKMEIENLLAVPIETIYKVDNKIVHASATKYKNDLSYGLIYPEEQYILETNTPLSTFAESGDGEDFTSYTLWGTFHLYNTMGNILEYSKSSNIKTSFIWSYEQAYPVIRGENISNSDLQSAVNSAMSSVSGYTTLDDLTDALIGKMHGESGNLRSKWAEFNAALRNLSVLDNSLITTYTYDPLIGLTSQTDPNGITTYYEYEDFNHLELIEDEYGNIVQHQEYHYKEQ